MRIDNNLSSQTRFETQPTIKASSETDKLRKLRENSGKGNRKNQQLTAQQQKDISVSQKPLEWTRLQSCPLYSAMLAPSLV
ncbi:hypothetical protein FD723_23340 [Nostoc sp. C052]|uniref:hypothetical protein n=1 Tax=Nostoc sp. C052 TaxID=2576902 RepID=UPI0015C2CCC4|nr:hypothetical protein [Nostoc sp. C052]QLE43090.1 hypothetical protein FD723_23340 [Nostoc sp. C052]